MKIEKISIKNLKAIKDIEANLYGATIVVRGNNNAGKSTFLKSIPDRIRGVRPSQVVNFTESNGSARLELTDGTTFEWTFDNTGREKLNFHTPEGLRGPVTREIAKKYFPEQFDIDKFIESDPKTMAKTLLNLSGVDVSPYENEYKRLYDERTVVNRDIKKLEATLDLSKLDLSLPKIEIDSAEYLNLYTSETEKATKYNSIKKQAELMELSIAKLAKQLADLQEELSVTNIFLNDPANQPVDNLADIKSALDNAAETNILIRKNNETLKRKEELDNLRAEQDTIADAMVKNEAKKKEIINSMKLPEGFQIDDGELKYNGYPLEKEQLSTSALYIAALKLALLTVGEVHSLYFDASPLDPISLKEVIEWGNENNVQLLIEIPADTGGQITYQLVQEVEAPKVEAVDSSTIDSMFDQADPNIPVKEEVPRETEDVPDELDIALQNATPTPTANIINRIEQIKREALKNIAAPVTSQSIREELTKNPIEEAAEREKVNDALNEFAKEITKKEPKINNPKPSSDW